MNFVKSFVPFTNENRILRESVVENAKLFLRFSLFSRTGHRGDPQPPKTEETPKKPQGLKRNFSMPTRHRSDSKKNKPNPAEEKPPAEVKTTVNRANTQREPMRPRSKPVVRRKSFAPNPNRESGRFCKVCDGTENSMCHEDKNNHLGKFSRPFSRQNSVMSNSGESTTGSASSRRVLKSMDNVTFDKPTKSAQAKHVMSPQPEKPTLKENVKSFPTTLRSYDRLPNKSSGTGISSSNLQTFQRTKSTRSSSSNLQRFQRQNSTVSNNSAQSVIPSNGSLNKPTKNINKSSTDINLVEEFRSETIFRATPSCSLNLDEEIPIKMELPPLLVNETVSEEITTRILNWDMESISEGFIDDDFNFPDIDLNSETLGKINNAENQMDILKDELSDVFETLNAITRRMEGMDIRPTEL